MQSSKYAITGLGLYNGLGKTVTESWNNLIGNKTSIQTVNWPSDVDHARFPSTYSHLKTTVGAMSPSPAEEECIDKFKHAWKDWDPNTRTGLISVNEAVNDAKLTSTNSGVIFSTFGAGSTVRLDFFSALDTGKTKYSPRKCLNIGLDYPATQVASVYKFNGPNTSVDSACTTGISSIEIAVNMLNSYPDLDAMVVGASDRMLEPIYTYWFQSMSAMSPTGISSPFDKNRNGFIMGEGAGTLIIEPLDKAIKRNATIHAVIHGISTSTYYESDTSPDSNGTGATISMQQAISRSNIEITDIDYINAHATSTPIGDQIEYDAISKLFTNIPVVSNKGQIGHSMSSTGIIELIYTIKAMQTGISPGNYNLNNPIGNNVLLPTSTFECNIQYALKNSFGFGGRNASIVISKT